MSYPAICESDPEFPIFELLFDTFRAHAIRHSCSSYLIRSLCEPVLEIPSVCHLFDTIDPETFSHSSFVSVHTGAYSVIRQYGV